MEKALSIEPKENGELILILTVKDKSDVNILTIDMMSHCDDVLYEPGSRNGSYESCLLYNEKIAIRIRAAMQ